MPTTGAEARGSARRLLTDRLTLRPPVTAEAATIERLAGDPAIALNTTNIPHPYPPGGAAAWLAGLSDEVEIVWAIERREDAAFVGCIGLRVKAGRRTAVPGYWIGKPYWGKG